MSKTRDIVMSKIDLKKTKKRQDILDAAYELFTTNGFSKTTILNIALKAGVGKGTFYLYFDSKEDVRDELIAAKTSKLLTEAIQALEESEVHEEHLAGTPTTVSDGFIFVADYILSYLSKDLTLLKFISKNLSWGLFFQSNHLQEKNDGVIDFKQFIDRILDKNGVRLRNAELVIYTMIEMINSTCYSVLVNSDPVPFTEYKPYLYHCIRMLIEDAVEQ